MFFFNPVIFSVSKIFASIIHFRIFSLILKDLILAYLNTHFAHISLGNEVDLRRKNAFVMKIETAVIQQIVTLVKSAGKSLTGYQIYSKVEAPPFWKKVDFSRMIVY